MKRLLIAAAVSLALPLAVMAGGAGKSDSWHAKKMERMTQELQLNDEQKTQVEAIFKEQWEKHKALRQETRSRLETVLTPEQMTKMDEMRKRRGEHHKGGMRGPGGEMGSKGERGPGPMRGQ